MKIELIFGVAFLLVLASSLSAQTPDYFVYYKLNISYEAGQESTLKINNVAIEFSEKEFSYYGNYSIRALDTSGKKLDQLSINIPDKILYDITNDEGEIVDGGKTQLDAVDFIVYVPYYENAHTLAVYDSSHKELATYDISIYAKDFSGDENANINEGEIETGPYSEGNLVRKNWIYWVMGLILIIIFIGIGYYIKRGES